MSSATIEDFLDDLSDRVTKESGPPWIAYGPRFAKDKGAETPPPENISEPVWAPSTGWTERAEIEPKAGRPGPFLLLYGPDTEGND